MTNNLSLTSGSSYRTKQEFVYHTLRNAIMSCELPPGKRLVINEIASQLDTSAIPVREALRLLHSEDLVEHNPHVGTVVSPISKDSIIEIFAVKEGLETVATRIAVQQMSPEDLKNLDLILEQMDEALRKKEYEEWGVLNRRFHSTIVDITSMSMMKEMNQRIMDRWDRIRRYFFNEVLVHRLIRSQQEHHEIMNAIRDNDDDKAAKLAGDHNRYALKDYMEYISCE